MKLIESITTWQGEGPCTGKLMLLLRFKNCNKKCKWCDTMVKMRILREMEMTIEEIQDIVKEKNCGIMITGGEPTLKPYINDVARIINEVECESYNVETNGYDLLGLIERVKTDKNVYYIYSPKIFSDEDLVEETERTRNIAFLKHVYIKVVFEENENIYRYLQFLNSMNLNHRVYLMPEGVDRVQLLRNSPKVFDVAEKFNFNFSSRLHLMHDFV
jgi:organic radical activating enzyme